MLSILQTDSLFGAFAVLLPAVRTRTYRINTSTVPYRTVPYRSVRTMDAGQAPNFELVLWAGVVRTIISYTVQYVLYTYHKRTVHRNSYHYHTTRKYERVQVYGSYWFGTVQVF